MNTNTVKEITIEDSFISEFTEMMKRNIKELIKESCQVACAVYQMHVIEKMSAKEIADEFDTEVTFIDMYVQYYDLLLSWLSKVRALYKRSYLKVHF